MSIMKKYLFLAVLALAIPVADTQAQLVRDVPHDGIDATGNLIRPAGENFVSNFLGSAFDDSHFQMKNSYALSYSSGIGRTLGQYTNTMMYQFDFPVTLRADVSYLHDPLSSFSSSKSSQPNINQLYLQNAEMEYKPSKDFAIKLQYMQVPYAAYYGYGSPFGYMRSPFGW